MYKLVGILILHIFVYKYFDAWDKEVLIIGKFIIGMVFSLISMCTAGVVEVFRQKQCIGSKIFAVICSIFFEIF